MDIGKRIQERRKALKLSVEDVAKKLNKNRTTVYRYEKGDIGNLPLETLKPLADILDTTPAYLMGWEDKNDNVSEDPPLLQNNFVAYVSLFEEETFTDEEYGKILEYAKFLVYLRDK